MDFFIDLMVKLLTVMLIMGGGYSLYALFATWYYFWKMKREDANDTTTVGQRYDIIDLMYEDEHGVRIITYPLAQFNEIKNRYVDYEWADLEAALAKNDYTLMLCDGTDGNLIDSNIMMNIIVYNNAIRDIMRERLEED